MTSEIQETEASLTEILSSCFRKFGATKAALYLSQNGGPYELRASFGFRRPPRQRVSGNDLVVDRLITRKGPFAINGASSDPKFYDLLFHAGTDQMMVVPIYAHGQLVGFLDVRDKTDRQPFGPADAAESKEIISLAMAALGRSSPLVFSGEGAPSPSPQIRPAVDESAAKVIERATLTVERTLNSGRAIPATLNESELAAVGVVMPAILTLPGSVMAAVSFFSPTGNLQYVAARSTVTTEAMTKFDEKLRGWVRKQGKTEPSESMRARTLYPFGESGPPIGPALLTTILSAPVVVGSISGLILTVAFETSPERQARTMLESFLELIRQTIEHAISHESLRAKTQRIAENLLEPDFQKYPDLVDHCRRVSNLSEQLARHAGLPSAEVERIRIAALVHEVGTRLIDYQRLYKKPAFNEADIQLMRNHPIVGAAVIAQSSLGDDIAGIVLAHHERTDGKGYPYGITGERIPMGARIIHICDTFDAMTSLNSYQPPVPESTALLQIQRLAGADFDVELVAKFSDMLSQVETYSPGD